MAVLFSLLDPGKVLLSSTLAARSSHVENPESVQCGTALIELDGRELDSNVIPLSSLRGRHDVRVLLGVAKHSESVNPQ